MDIQQLRSWIFELYEPLSEERTFLFLRGRDGTLVDLPAFDRRAVRSIQGVCDPKLVFFSHAERAREIAKWRAALPGLRFAIHAADADRVAGGVDQALADGDVLTREPESRIVHVGAPTPGTSLLLAELAGGVLFTGDVLTGTPSGGLALAAPAYADPDRMRAGLEKLRAYEFSAALSARGRPVWSAAKERYLELLQELPRARRRFGHIVDAPWDREYLRVRSQMAPNPLVPNTDTIAAAAAHGPSTLVSAWERKATREVAWEGAGGAAAPAASAVERKRWSLATEGPTAQPPQPAGPAQTVSAPELEHAPTFRRLAALELCAIPHVDWSHGSFDLSRDGADVLFSWDRSGQPEIYRAPVAGDAIYQLTTSERASVQPRISPDGRSVAFLREAAGGFEVWLVASDGSRERRLTLPASWRAGLAWSPDARSLVFFSDESGARALHVVDVVGGAARVVARDLLVGESAPAWSPDGSWLAYAAGDADLNADLYVVAADGSSPPRRVGTRGGSPGQSVQPRFDPRDPARLVFATDVRGRFEIAIASLAGGAALFLREGHHDETDPVWDVEPDRIVYRRTAEGFVTARRVYLVSRDDEPVLDSPGVHFAVRVRPNSDLVYHWSGPHEPADVFVKAKDAIAPRRITRSLPPTISASVFVQPRHERYRAPDGLSVPALLYLPHREAVDGDGARPPAIVYAHGGPVSQHRAAFDVWAQWFANRGYVVLAPNVRGSTGYGRAFRDASRGDVGGKDLEDLAAGAAWLLDLGIADPRRVGAFGVSFGGYHALRAAERWPHVFAATVSHGGPITLEQLARTQPLLAPPDRARRSVLAEAAALRVPALLLYGERDPAAADVRRLVEALREQGTAFSYHFYPDEGHMLTRRADRADALDRTIEFFDEHVRSRAPVAVSPG